jgi:dTDP-4-amino-4,6-dideoxy-D-galactose acyltransferase
MIQTGILCERLDWDSRFFGLSIARAVPTHVDTATCRAILDWCRVEKIDCLYFLADEDADAMRVLENAAFVRVDDRVTLELQPVPPSRVPPDDVRAARPDDVAALGEIAAISHRDSRFYYDGRFDRGRCDDLYRVWVENSCNRWADHVVAVEREGAAIGYLTVHLREPKSAMLGLLGVNPAFAVRALAVGCSMAPSRGFPGSPSSASGSPHKGATPHRRDSFRAPVFDRFIALSGITAGSHRRPAVRHDLPHPVQPPHADAGGDRLCV